MVPNKRVCVVGAGPSGIAAAKNCILFGLDVVVFEKGDKVGCNWVYHGLRRDLRGELLKAGVDIGKPPMGNKRRYKSFERMPPSSAVVAQ
jgi:cation diffusion facilitator CzcD-associated flavoprotein CzcO